MKRIVFAPLTNTLSHVTDCLAVADLLDRRRYDVVFLTTRHMERFIVRSGYTTDITPEIWEGHGEQDVFSWFDDVDRFRRSFDDEVKALGRLLPDLVVTSYRYTTSLACRHLSVPCYSIIGANMSPAFEGMLGVAPELIDGRTRAAIRNVYRGKLSALRRAFSSWPMPEAADIRHLLEGDRTFLHTFPDFEPLAELPRGYSYVGPLNWAAWSRLGGNVKFERSRSRRVLVFLGSVIASLQTARTVLGALDKPDTEIIAVVPARQRNRLAVETSSATVQTVEHVALDEVLPDCDLALVHGGLNVLHYCLRHGTRCLIFPYQPEQAQNALRAEAIGFGRNVVSQRFMQDIRGTETHPIVQRIKIMLRYSQYLVQLKAEEIADAVDAAISDDDWADRCRCLARQWAPVFVRYDGASAVKRAIEAGVGEAAVPDKS